jgi:hypothetical protein
MLMPAPTLQMHNQYVRNYINTGQPKILGRMNEFVAVHRDRYVVPVRLQISHVSGIGEDRWAGVGAHLQLAASSNNRW